MSRNGVPPFTGDHRACGMLLHVTSLPSSYGIGDLGPAALSWIDLLEQAGQSYWQALPLGPTGYGNSPYQPSSSFAGNELLVSPEWLIQDELLELGDCAHPLFPTTAVDYDAVTLFKHGLFETAWKRFRSGVRADLRPAYEQFRNDQNYWLSDYALFRTLKAKFKGAYYLEWPSELVQRKPAALEKIRSELASEIDEACFEQFLLFRQADRLKSYAHEKGLTLVGDMPFFVSPDSSDVWGNPELFLLDEQHRPRFVAGVPPDYFTAKGQLWGNPVYDWEQLRRSGYRWWIDRLRSLLTHVDVIRLDHFRGFAAAWHIPAGSPTAETGKWVQGPAADFLSAVEKELGSLPLIAEDLGFITPDVHALRDQFHLPGMRVLQFAFDGHTDNPYLPENYISNTVVYTGTHDNPPTREWFQDLSVDQQAYVWKALRERGAKSREAARAMMEVGWSSAASLAMAPLQDLLNLDKDARMNVPGRPDGNWRWRCTKEILSDAAFDWLRILTKNVNRSRNLISGAAKTLETASIN